MPRLLKLLSRPVMQRTIRYGMMRRTNDGNGDILFMKRFLSIELQDSTTAQEAAYRLHQQAMESGIEATAEGNVLRVSLTNPLISELFSWIGMLASAIRQLFGHLRTSQDPAPSA